MNYLKNHLLLVLVISFYINGNAQTHSTGALALPDSVYFQIPLVNWDTLIKYSGNNGSSNRVISGLKVLTAPPIEDQGSQNSCVGWAVGYTAMSILTYPKFNCWSTATRSPSYVYNQIKQGGSDCLGGSFVTSALNLSQNQGVCSINLMPYINSSCSTLPNVTQINDAAQNKAIGYYRLTTNSVNDIKSAIDLGFPVINIFDVKSDFDNMWNNGGVWSTNSGPIISSLLHATCIVGYDDTKQMFKTQNQWGTSGGDDSYFWITYNLVQANCFKELYVLYAANNLLPNYITGEESFCNSSIYTLNNLPAGSSVSWSAQPSGIVSFNPTGPTQSSTTTVSKITNGDVTLQASVTNSCGVQSQVTLPVTVGPPTLKGYYTIVSNYHNCPGCQYPLGQNNVIWLPGNQSAAVRITITNPDVTDISWTRTGYPFSWTPNNKIVDFTPVAAPGAYQSRIVNFNGTPVHPCGSLTTTLNFNIMTQGWGSFRVSASPNPASNNINVLIDQESSEVQNLPRNTSVKMKLYALYESTLIKQWNFINDRSTYSINLPYVTSGQYILEVTKSTFSEGTIILINR